jgi:hypothetical protein
MSRKPKTGKVKIKIEDAEITEAGVVIITADITHPPDRKGELLILRGIPLHEVDEVARARALCFQWLNDQGFATEEINQYVVYDEVERYDAAYWHANFWDDLTQDIDRVKLEEDWNAYWDNQARLRY